MDIDSFVAAHRGEWDRLEALSRTASRRTRRIGGAEVDELVTLYQRAATHLALVQSRAPDPAVVARLSRTVAAGRAAVTGHDVVTRAGIARWFVETFPAAVYRSWRWIVPTAIVSLGVALALGIWVDTHPDVQRNLLPPAEVRTLVSQQFASYYRSHPARDFATQVWTNNAYVAAICVVGGIVFGIPVLFSLFQNMVNVGVIGGYLVAAGRGGEFFSLILPHGMLELSCVFVAAGAGLRIGWTVAVPGARTRAVALAEEGRATITIALGLVLVLAISGMLEAFVTPSGLSTWARIGIGGIAEIGFVTYVAVLGRRAARLGRTGDLDLAARGDVVPVAA